MSSSFEIPPYKFLDSYSKEDHDVFFGRDQEVEEVYSRVFQSKLLLIYGASGTGKSSIINCGLANKFQDSDWLPIHIRRSGNMSRSLLQQIQKNAFQEIKLTDERNPTSADIKTALNSVFLDHFKPIYLIFDQFEELFIFGYKEEWIEFIKTLQNLISGDLDVRFIFVMRGEYLEFLSEFEEFIPDFFDNRVRIEKMTRNQATKSISGPAEVASIRLEDGFEEALLKKLSPDKTQIELTFLQVFLDKIHRIANLEAQEGNSVEYTNQQLEKLGNVSDVLAEFVDEQLFKMDNPKAALTILKSFVSLQGTKVQRTKEEVYQYSIDLGQSISLSEVDDILAELVNKRILKDKDDNEQYELRHDSLAQKIYEKITHQEKELLDVRQFLTFSLNEYEKRNTLLSESDLVYIAPYERLLILDDQTRDFIELSKKNSTRRKKARRIQWVVVGIILLLLISSVIGFVNSRIEKQRAEELAQLAQQESDEATRQRNIALEQSKLAETNESRAKEQASLAEIAKAEAENQKEFAVTQQQIAELEKQRAEEARQEAIVNEKDALTQKEIAEREKAESYRLRLLSVARELSIKSGYVVDDELKGLLAKQAYNFNTENNGSEFQPDIYTALLKANGALKQDGLSRLHDLAVIEIAPTSKSILSVSNDGKIINQTEARTLFTSQLKITSADVYAKGQKTVIGTLDGQLLNIDLTNGTITDRYANSGAEVLGVLQFDQSVLAVQKNGLIASYNLSGELLRELDIGSNVSALKKNADKIWLSTSENDIYVISSDLSINRKLNAGIKSPISAIEADEKNDYLFVGRKSGMIEKWSINEETLLQVLPGHTSEITGLALSPTNKMILSSSFDRTARLWQLTNQDEPPVVLSHDSWTSSLAFAGKEFFVGTFDGGLSRYNLNASDYAQSICEEMTRKLSQEEWKKYIAEDIPYEKVCK